MRNGRREKKMSKQPPPAPSASEIGPCPTIIQGWSGGAMVGWLVVLGLTAL